jgi:hypothetical protein
LHSTKKTRDIICANHTVSLESKRFTATATFLVFRKALGDDEEDKINEQHELAEHLVDASVKAIIAEMALHGEEPINDVKDVKNIPDSKADAEAGGADDGDKDEEEEEEEGEDGESDGGHAANDPSNGPPYTLDVDLLDPVTNKDS